MIQMQRIIEIFKKQGGSARMKELKAASVHTRDVQRLIAEGLIEKITPGLYKLVDLPETDGVPVSFVDICRAIPPAIICLLSALDYYVLTTVVPSQVYVAVPNSFKPPKIEYPSATFFYFAHDFMIWESKNRDIKRCCADLQSGKNNLRCVQISKQTRGRHCS
jgi:predicted transcriptional regulator of viral defense system